MNSPTQSVEKTSPPDSLWIRRLHFLLGLSIAAVVAWLGSISSEWLGKSVLGFEKSPISSIMLAILIGLLLANVFRIPDSFKTGIQFAIKILLKLGIICLGIRLSLGAVLQVGALGLPIIIFCMLGGLLFAQWLSQRLALSPKLGILIAIGTSICGATAIVATAPAIEADEEEVAYAVANITIFGILAMFFYPFLAHWLFAENALASGLMLGTAIHETSQVAGSALMFVQNFGNDAVLDVATVTKLVRNLFMVALIPLMAYRYRRDTGASSEQLQIRKIFPSFILGFIAFVLLRTIGDMSLSNGVVFGSLPFANWDSFIKMMQQLAEICLTIAMAAIGLGTNLQALRRLGIKPFYVGFGAASLVAALSIAALLTLKMLGVLS